MKRLLATAALLWLGACGGTASTPPTYVNRSGYDAAWASALADDIWATTESIAGDSIDLSGYTIYLDDDATPQCSEAEAFACAYPANGVIEAAFPQAETLGLTQAQMNGVIAENYAHELGHVYYYETTGDADSQHTHSEWFDRANANSVQRRVGALFVGNFQP